METAASGPADVSCICAQESKMILPQMLQAVYSLETGRIWGWEEGNSLLLGQGPRVPAGSAKTWSCCRVHDEGCSHPLASTAISCSFWEPLFWDSGSNSRCCFSTTSYKVQQSQQSILCRSSASNGKAREVTTIISAAARDESRESRREVAVVLTREHQQGMREVTFLCWDWDQEAAWFAWIFKVKLTF